MAIFAQTYKSVDSQITELEQRLQQLQDYRQQLQSADETAKSSLQALSEAMRGLKPEHAEEVKREVTRYLGLDNLPATDSTTLDDSENGASGESETTDSTTSDRKPVSVFDSVGKPATDSAPESSENGKSSQSEAATDSGDNGSTASAPDSSENGNSSESQPSDASDEDENGVVRHEFFTDDYIQIEDSEHQYNGRVCLIKTLVKKGYHCLLEPRTDEEGSEREELLLKPYQVKAYKLPTQQESESIGSGVFPEFSVNQRVNVRQNGNEFKQGTITKINTDGTARVKLDNYPNSISVAFKDMQTLKKSTPATSTS
jgi:hypothetical protein